MPPVAWTGADVMPSGTGIGATVLSNDAHRSREGGRYRRTTRARTLRRSNSSVRYSCQAIRTWAQPPVLAILLLTVGAAAQAQLVPAIGSVPLQPARIEAVEAAISAEMARAGIPGLSAAIGLSGDLKWSSGYGLADVENSVPAKAETAYRLASVTKPMTAVTVLRLAEQGKLDLEAPIQRYVPSFPDKGRPITPRLLLGHLGGIRHYSEGEFVSTRHYESVVDALAVFRDDPLAFEPGTKFHYTSYGYNLLGAAAEGAAGRPFLDELHEAVLLPAGMNRTRADDHYEIIPNRAAGYIRTAAGELANSALADTSAKIPGGGLSSTAPDVARFGLALIGSRLVRNETLGAMLTPQKTRDGRSTGSGLGLFLGERGGRREAWHTGGQQRVSTILFLQPDTGLVVALLTNLEEQGSALLVLARRIADTVVDRPPSGAASAASPRRRPR